MAISKTARIGGGGFVLTAVVATRQVFACDLGLISATRDARIAATRCSWDRFSRAKGVGYYNVATATARIGRPGLRPSTTGLIACVINGLVRTPTFAVSCRHGSGGRAPQAISKTAHIRGGGFVLTAVVATRQVFACDLGLIRATRDARIAATRCSRDQFSSTERVGYDDATSASFARVRRTRLRSSATHGTTASVICSRVDASIRLRKDAHFILGC